MSVIINNPLDKYHKTITGLSLRCPLAYFCRKIEKIEPNKIPCCWIPFLLVSLARQFEMLMTALLFFSIDQAKSSMQDESGFAALVDRVVTDATRW